MHVYVAPTHPNSALPVGSTTSEDQLRQCDTSLSQLESVSADLLQHAQAAVLAQRRWVFGTSCSLNVKEQYTPPDGEQGLKPDTTQLSQTSNRVLQII